MSQVKSNRLVVGCMSGTSLDGLDAALVRIEGEGLAMRAQGIALAGRSFDPTLRERLRGLASGRPATAEQFTRSARALGEFHAQVIAALCAGHKTEPQKLDFVVAHGQTVFHAGDEHLSWQLFDPWPIARRLSVPVCYDLRQTDLIAAGRGAPITPLADWILFRHPTRSRWIVNLGGVCNVTYLPPANQDSSEAAIALIRGGDIGPCNLLIDGLVRRLFPDRAFDKDGRIAAAADWDRIDDAPDHPILQAVRDSTGGETDQPQTLGREQFNEVWIDGLTSGDKTQAAGRELVAWAVEAVARRLCEEITADRPSEVVLAGGGAKNPVLVDRIRRALVRAGSTGAPVILSSELGIEVEAREPAAMAVLGALSADGLPITLGAVTGAYQPGRAGAWVYP